MLFPRAAFCEKQRHLARTAARDMLSTSTIPFSTLADARMHTAHIGWLCVSL